MNLEDHPAYKIARIFRDLTSIVGYSYMCYSLEVVLSNWKPMLAGIGIENLNEKQILLLQNTAVRFSSLDLVKDLEELFKQLKETEPLTVQDLIYQTDIKDLKLTFSVENMPLELTIPTESYDYFKDYFSSYKKGRIEEIYEERKIEV